MIKILATYKRHRIDLETNVLLMQELVVEDHAKMTKVCNMVSAVSLYGIKALRNLDHWSIIQKKGLLIVKNIYPDGSSSSNDSAVLRTIVIQLSELAKEFPKEIKLQVVVKPTHHSFDSDKSSNILDEDEISDQKSQTGKTGKGL
jgi:uncharacterized protein YsxB (DUF464 family)